MMAYRQEETVAEIIQALRRAAPAAAVVPGPRPAPDPETRKSQHDRYRHQLRHQGSRHRLRPPFVIIGERINPTGRKILAAEMVAGDFSRVVADALAQVEAGAHMLDVNAGIPLADEPALLAGPSSWCSR